MSDALSSADTESVLGGIAALSDARAICLEAARFLAGKNVAPLQEVAPLSFSRKRSFRRNGPLKIEVIPGNALPAWQWPLGFVTNARLAVDGSLWFPTTFITGFKIPKFEFVESPGISFVRPIYARYDFNAIISELNILVQTKSWGQLNTAICREARGLRLTVRFPDAAIEQRSGTRIPGYQEWLMFINSKTINQNSWEYPSLAGLKVMTKHGEQEYPALFEKELRKFVSSFA